MKTPARAALALPTRALAEAVAEEWNAQGETLRPHTMKLTKLANTAIDRVAGNEAEVAAQILAYANDLLCYRAAAPAELAGAAECAVEPAARLGGGPLCAAFYRHRHRPYRASGRSAGRLPKRAGNL